MIHIDHEDSNNIAKDYVVTLDQAFMHANVQMSYMQYHSMQSYLRR